MALSRLHDEEAARAVFVRAIATAQQAGERLLCCCGLV